MPEIRASSFREAWGAVGCRFAAVRPAFDEALARPPLPAGSTREHRRGRTPNAASGREESIDG
jgi:hypothetical protein